MLTSRGMTQFSSQKLIASALCLKNLYSTCTNTSVRRCLPHMFYQTCLQHMLCCYDPFAKVA